MTEGWVLWQFSDSIFTLEQNGCPEPSIGQNIVTRSIPEKLMTERALAFRGLERIEKRGIAESIRMGCIKLFKGMDYALFEFQISSKTVWRMFLHRDPENAFIVIIDVFKSHKGVSNNPARTRANSREIREKFCMAELLANMIRGGGSSWQ